MLCSEGINFLVFTLIQVTQVLVFTVMLLECVLQCDVMIPSGQSCKSKLSIKSVGC